jgi:AcrR family transcriptional regulator
MPRQRMSKDERIRQILARTLDLVGRKPLAAIRTADIAAAAGLSEAALYRHFASREAIFEAIIAQYLAQRPALPPVERIRSVAQFRQSLGDYLDGMLAEDPGRLAHLRLLLQISLERHPQARAKYAQVREGLWSWMETLIERGERDWGFRPALEPALLVRLVHFGALLAHIEQAVFAAREDDPIEAGEIREGALDLLFAALGQPVDGSSGPAQAR